jgi:hypothetical protein
MDSREVDFINRLNWFLPTHWAGQPDFYKDSRVVVTTHSEREIDKILIEKREYSVALEWWDMQLRPISFWNKLDKSDVL